MALTLPCVFTFSLQGPPFTLITALKCCWVLTNSLIPLGERYLFRLGSSLVVVSASKAQGSEFDPCTAPHA